MAAITTVNSCTLGPYMFLYCMRALLLRMSHNILIYKAPLTSYSLIFMIVLNSDMGFSRWKVAVLCKLAGKSYLT